MIIVRRYWSQLALVGLLAVMAWSNWLQSLENAQLLRKADHWAAVMRTTDERIKTAAATSQRNALARARAVEQDNLKRKETSDAKLAYLNDRVRDLADDYARRMRYRPEGARSDGGRAGVPGPGSPAPFDHGSSADAVVVSRADFDICTENSARTLNAYDWSLNRRLPSP